MKLASVLYDEWQGGNCASLSLGTLMTETQGASWWKQSQQSPFHILTEETRVVGTESSFPLLGGKTPPTGTGKQRLRPSSSLLAKHSDCWRPIRLVTSARIVVRDKRPTIIFAPLCSQRFHYSVDGSQKTAILYTFRIFCFIWKRLRLDFDEAPVMYFSYFSSMTFGFSIHTMKETVTLHKDPNMEAFVPQGYFTCLQASVNGFGFCWHNFSALGP